MSDVMPEDKKRIDRWFGATQRVNGLKRELNSAETEVLNAQQSLGSYLCPTDAKVGETFAVWYGDSLINVTKINQTDFTVGVRHRGKSL